MKKERLLCHLLGGILTIGNIIGLSISYILPAKDPFLVTKFDLLIQNFFSVLSVFPLGIPVLYSVVAKEGSPLSIIVMWQFVMILCGVGIVAKKNLARIVFIVCCSINILLIPFRYLLIAVFYNDVTPTPTIIEVLLNPYLIMTAAYMFILTRPKLKTLFENA